MKRSLFLLVIFFVSLSISMAQNSDERSNQAFRFIYIIHDTTTVTERLINDVLYDVEDRTIANDQKCMICLSNGIATKEGNEYFEVMILKGTTYKSYFDRIIEELRTKNQHDFDISRDIEHIINIFNREHDFLNENGELFYESMTFDFYLTRQFCDNGYAEKLITPLYLAFDVPNMPNRFNFNVWVGAADSKNYDYSPERIFGEKNYNKINENVIIMEY